MLATRHNPKKHRFILSMPEYGINYLSEIETYYQHNSFRHSHAEMQIIWVFSGHMKMDIRGQVLDLPSNSACLIAPGVEHEVLPIKQSRRVEIVDLRLIPAVAAGMMQYASPLVAQNPIIISQRELNRVVASLRRAANLSGAAKIASVLSNVWSLLALLTAPTQNDADSNQDAGVPRHVEPRIRIADDFMRDQLNNGIDVSDIARLVDLSPSQLTRLYIKHLGTSPAARLKQIRIEHAKQLLASTTLSVKQISVACGFACPNYFSRAFHETTGFTPMKFRAAEAAK